MPSNPRSLHPPSHWSCNAICNEGNGQMSTNVEMYRMWMCNVIYSQFLEIPLLRYNWIAIAAELWHLEIQVKISNVTQLRADLLVHGIDRFCISSALSAQRLIIFLGDIAKQCRNDFILCTWFGFTSDKACTCVNPYVIVIIITELNWTDWILNRLPSLRLAS